MRRPIVQTSGMCCRGASDRPRARATFHFRGHWALQCDLADAYWTCCELCFHGGEVEFKTHENSADAVAKEQSTT